MPNVNFVTNIGFSEAATHTLNADERHVVPSRAMEFPLRHPAAVRPCEMADQFEKRYMHRLSRFPLLDSVYSGIACLFALDAAGSRSRRTVGSPARAGD